MSIGRILAEAKSFFGLLVETPHRYSSGIIACLDQTLASLRLALKNLVVSHISLQTLSLCRQE
jgi:putative NIF3 family GTP cyclohydrolase 1 type 2